MINNEETVYEDKDYEDIDTCPNCEEEVIIMWNPVRNGFQTVCPYCGERLMLCDLCQNRTTGEAIAPPDCDYCSETGTCMMKRS